jgi:hypothetical protein
MLNYKFIQNKKLQPQYTIKALEQREIIRTEINNFKQKNTPFVLKESYNSIIPLRVYTCWHTKDLPPKMAINYKELVDSNPEFECHLYDENECREFIKNNFRPDVLQAYDSLIPRAYKADLWRYCVLFINGGIYIDIKYKCANGFKLIALTEKEYFVRDIESRFKLTYNALIVCLPNSNIMLGCINKIVENVKNKYYGERDLFPTGPGLLGSFFTDEQIKNFELHHGKCIIRNILDTIYICYNNKIILGKYNEYYEEQKQTQNVPRYGYLWSKKMIYKN